MNGVRGSFAAIAGAVVLLCALTASAGAQTYNPASSAELSSALAAAAASPESDTIALAAGAQLTAPATGDGFKYDGASGGALKIVGGGLSTVLAGDPLNYSILSLTGNVSVESLTVIGNGVAGQSGIGVRDGSSIALSRVVVRGAYNGLSSRLSATIDIRNSLFDLGMLTKSVPYAPPAAVLLANDAGNSHVNVHLQNATIVGSGEEANGIALFAYPDYADAAYQTIDVAAKNSVVAMTGASAHDLACPNFSMDYSTETVAFDHVASDPTTFVTTDCSTMTNTNAVNRAAKPLLLGADGLPGVGSSAIDAGDPAFVPTTAELDLVGNSRVFGAAVDLGAYEFGSSPPIAPPAAPSKPALTLKFGKTRGKIRAGKKARALRKAVKKSKPRISVSLSAAAKVTFKLAPKPKKGKRAKYLRGSVKLNLKVGTSYLTWNAKWGRKTLKAGNYLLTASATGLAKPVTLKVKIAR